eukprot:jgi/Mesen1/5578/ME000281S04635
MLLQALPSALPCKSISPACCDALAAPERLATNFVVVQSGAPLRRPCRHSLNVNAGEQVGIFTLSNRSNLREQRGALSGDSLRRESEFLGRPVKSESWLHHGQACTAARCRPAVRAQAQKKGFGGGGFGGLLKEKMSAKQTKPATLSCPCGGGESKLEYKLCCGRYHGGVIEPDAVTLMKARYSAFARTVVPYLLRTTHPEHPDYSNGDESLENDCKVTCDRLIFKHLEILEHESSTPPPDGTEAVQEEAFVTFKVTYAFKKGTDGGNHTLEEKSRFVRENGRWLYREKIPVDEASDIAWQLNSWLQNESDPKRKTWGHNTGRSH